MDIREAITKAKGLHPDANAQEVLTTLIHAAEEVAPERRLVLHDGYGRRKRYSTQVKLARTLRPGRRNDDKDWKKLPRMQRTGPADRRKVRKDVDKWSEGNNERRIFLQRRATDRNWRKLPIAMSEAERRARRAVAAIPGAEFVEKYENTWFIQLPKFAGYYLGFEIVDAINDLLDRAETAERKLASISVAAATPTTRDNASCRTTATEF